MSTAPWDRPRQGTTVTVYCPDSMTITDGELIELIQRRHRAENRAVLVEPKVEYVNRRLQGFGGEPGSVCFGLSWKNVR